MQARVRKPYLSHPAKNTWDVVDDEGVVVARIMDFGNGAYGVYRFVAFADSLNEAVRAATRLSPKTRLWRQKQEGD